MIKFEDNTDIGGVIDRISYKDLEIAYWTAEYFMAVQLRQKVAIDTETGEEIEMKGHTTYIPIGTPEEDVIREIYYLCLRWETHELNEFFKVDGHRPYNPHRKVLES